MKVKIDGVDFSRVAVLAVSDKQSRITGIDDDINSDQISLILKSPTKGHLFQWQEMNFLY